MATLSAAIVKHQVASMAEVEEALARQVLYGGDLVTNLLEAAAVSEAKLAPVLAASGGMGSAPPGELPRASATTLRLVPADLAHRHSIYPLEERPGELILAMAEPLPSEVENDLAFALGVNIIQLAAPLVRVRQAVSRDYGVPLERRFERLLARLEGHTPPPSSTLESSSSGTLTLPRPESLPPRAYPPSVQLPVGQKERGSASMDAGLLRGSPATSSGTTTAPQRTTPSAPARPGKEPDDRKATKPSLAAPPPNTLPGSSRPSATPTRPARPRLEQLAELARSSRPPPSQRQHGRPRRGPYTAAMAKEDLHNASSRDEVMRSFFDFCAQYFEYAVLFTVHGDLAEGWDAHGPGADRQSVASIAVPVDGPGSFAAARAAGTFRLGQLEATQVDERLLRDLGRTGDRAVLIVPVTVRGRCVLLLYGDHGNESVELESVGDVIGFAALASSALERVILQRKLAARRAVAVRSALESMPPPFVKRPRRDDLPSKEQRARALAQALAKAEGKPPGPPARATRELVTDPVHEAPTPAVLPRVRASWTAPKDAPPPPAAGRPPPRQTLAGTGPITSPPAPGVPSSTPSGDPAAAPVQRTPIPPAARGRRTAPGLAPRRQTARGVAPPPTPSPPQPDVTDTPEISVEATELDEGWSEYDGLDENGAPLAPASRSVHHEARPPGRRHSSKELKLPSVIVDTDSDVQVLIDRLLGGDETAVAQLVQVGEAAITALIARFPGPITVEPQRLESAQPSRCGPLLDVLARIGRPVEPFLLVRTNDADPHVRGWATRMLGEIRGPDAARAIAKRFTDEDESVRRAALSAARLIQKDADSRKALRDTLLKTANDEELPTGTRLAMLAALAGVRDPISVPAIIPLLTDPKPEIVQATEAALTVLTRRQFGTEVGRWTEWWDANGDRHRIEWLIDSLTHMDQEIRAAAGDELKKITKEYFGYYDDLPRKERARAQQRYREWWESRGKTIFS